MHPLILPYACPKGNFIIKTMNNSLKRFLCESMSHIYRSKTKDETKDLHKNDLLYYSKCPEPTCNEGYLGEAGRSIIERSSDGCGKDKQWHLICHALNNNC